MKRLFKFEPEDFGDLTVKVEHMDLLFDMFDDHTHVTSKMRVVAKEDITELALDAKRLEIDEVSANTPCTYEYKQKDNKLIVKFERTVKTGEKLTIKTRTVCRPTKNILEGLYYDETPKGAPPSQITQCQQWGFQRIAPCIDDMTAKCTYNTTIRADKRYTHLITNGDLVQDRKPLGEDRVEVKYENVKTPMPPYLFYLGVGTYDAYQKELEYPDGHKFTLEMLVPIGTDGERVKQALEILHDCVMWVHLFTGQDTYVNNEKSMQVWKLLKERDKPGVRDKIKSLIKGMRLGYKYTAKVYREIGMQNSDYGGMENVGNTTITANRMIPYPHMTDSNFEYMIGVKVHEYYHNLNGSEVTGWSPFEIWLNEAVTVHIESRYEQFVFGFDYHRIGRIARLVAPGVGTYTLDQGPASMPIEPDGFNDTNELISGITYVKAPEFVRMIETLVGRENFVKGLHNYHSKFTHGNAKRSDWIAAMEEVSGTKLSKLAQQWLKQKGFPTLKVTRHYQDGKLTLKLTQKGPNSQIWEFPFKLALFDNEGKMLEEKTVLIKDRETEVVFKVERPAFISLNRRVSFYGKLIFEADMNELMLQVRKDNDLIGRYLAFQEIMNKEKLRLLKDKKAKVSDAFIDLYFECISNNKLTDELGGLFMLMFEDVDHEEYAHKYQELYDVKRKIQKAIAGKYKIELLEMYRAYEERQFTGSRVEQMIAKVKPRQVKNLSLVLLANLDTPDIHSLIRKQFDTTNNASSRMVAFKLILNSSIADKFQIMKDYGKVAQKNPVSWETYMQVIASSDSDDVLEMVRLIERMDAFRIEQANEQRGLYSVFANNRKKSLLTAKGREFLTDSIIKLSNINEYNTNFVLKAFTTMDRVDKKYQVELVESLVRILEALDPEETPSVYTTAKRILMGSPIAVKSYEDKHGKIKVVD